LNTAPDSKPACLMSPNPAFPGRRPRRTGNADQDVDSFTLTNAMTVPSLLK
jgi:hypothetical protein